MIGELELHDNLVSFVYLCSLSHILCRSERYLNLLKIRREDRHSEYRRLEIRWQPCLEHPYVSAKERRGVNLASFRLISN